MGLVLGGLNLRRGGTRRPLPLGMLVRRLVVDGVGTLVGVGRARGRTVAEIAVVGVAHRHQRLPPHGEQAPLSRMPGEETLAQTRVHGELSRGGQVQTRKPTDGTCK